MKPKSLLITAALLGFLHAAAQTAVPVKTDLIGQKLPDVNVVDTDFNPLHLRWLIDTENPKPTVVVLYYRYCVPCGQLMRLLSRTTADELETINREYDRQYRMYDFNLLFIDVLNEDKKEITLLDGDPFIDIYKDDGVVRLCAEPTILYTDDEETMRRVFFSTDNSVPILLMVDSGGYVRDKMVGYSSKKKIEVLDMLETLTGGR